MSITLGRSVESLTVRLVPTDPFVCEIARDDATDWDPGTVCRLEFATEPETVWTATVVDDVLRFEVPEADVDAIIAANPPRVRLTLDTLIVASGKVRAERG